MLFIARTVREMVVFQSTPAIAGGRCAAVNQKSSKDTSFNPRPPLLAGDARPRRPLWPVGCCFNPRPPLLAGDAARSPSGLKVTLGFQSTPAIAGGRCSRSLMPWCCWPGFNPRPPLLAGDAQIIPFVREATIVSIHARHCWRAMRDGRSGLRSGFRQFQSTPAIAGGRCTTGKVMFCGAVSFNPRPPLLAGDADIVLANNEHDRVSIHARHCWRAMRLSRRCCTLGATVFQSTPAIAGGRCRATRGHRIFRGCFNPRPPLLAGDARSGRLCPGLPPRFNPRPPLLAGDATSRKTRMTFRWFQSTPAIAGGRCKPSSSAPTCWPWFQSTPAIAGGRCLGLLQVLGHRGHVSIHARHCWRAMPRT